MAEQFLSQIYVMGSKLILVLLKIAVALTFEFSLFVFPRSLFLQLDYEIALQFSFLIDIRKD